ncbi:uncharacterized protein LOC106770734 [Vigna radiata var. radiata]|uniref:Uncharacterized protein LOC106770734 n=1 Tax=Vigna radiata var. radiata TaxID=3916 RepID=A0A1S3V1J3_VIGRR|nr:uncharacterized protein LOC106770734 [Vigna radiata var. radiata]
MASSSFKLTLKLLIDTKREKVLYAETSKSVVDFLFNLLCLPIATVIRIVNKNQIVGSLGNLYQSVENLDETYMQPGQHKNLLLKPSALMFSPISGLLPSDNDSSSNSSSNDSTDVFYRYQYHRDYVTCDRTIHCPNCKLSMNAQMNFVGEKVANEIAKKSGFVKEVVTYIVMDDLTIEPLSDISFPTLLNKFNVKDLDDLETKVIELDMNEGVNLLKASMQSKTVLTDVFLKNSA